MNEFTSGVNTNFSTELNENFTIVTNPILKFKRKTVGTTTNRFVHLGNGIVQYATGQYNLNTDVWDATKTANFSIFPNDFHYKADGNGSAILWGIPGNWTSANPNNVLITTDWGVTWTSRATGLGGGVPQVYSADIKGNTVFLFGQGLSNFMRVNKSTDAGATFTEVFNTMFFSKQWSSIIMEDINTVFLLGFRNQTTTRHKITTDGGTTWADWHSFDAAYDMGWGNFVKYGNKVVGLKEFQTNSHQNTCYFFDKDTGSFFWLDFPSGNTLDDGSYSSTITQHDKWAFIFSVTSNTSIGRLVIINIETTEWSSILFPSVNFDFPSTANNSRFRQKDFLFYYNNKIYFETTNGLLYTPFVLAQV